MTAAQEPQVTEDETRTAHFLEAIELLREFTDDIPGSELRLPGGDVLWLHTERDVRAWLAEMADRIEQARVHEPEPEIELNPEFFAAGQQP